MATQPRGAAILNRNIAESLGAPPTYLAKVLQNLCRGNLLYSYRGKQGGFCLQENGEKITLMQIVIITEGPGFTKDCVLGLKICNDKAPCPMHKQWYPIKTEIVKLLESQTLDILSAAVMSGKYQLADLPAALMGELKSRT
jgi:Rrf2 family protein